MNINEITLLSLRTFEYIHHTMTIHQCHFFLRANDKFLSVTYEIGKTPPTPTHALQSRHTNHLEQFILHTPTLYAYDPKINTPFMVIK